MQCSEPGVASVASDVAECISIGGRETTIPAIAIDHGYLNERDDLLQEAAEAPILISKCNRDRWRSHCTNKGCRRVCGLLNSRTMWLAVASQRSSTGRTMSGQFLAMKESAATALKLAGVNVKTEESALYDSQSNGLAESAEKDAKDAGLVSSDALDKSFREDAVLACEVLRGDGAQAAEEVQMARQPTSCARDASSLWRESNRDGRMESSLVCLTGVMSSTWAQREACTKFEQSDVARPQNELTSHS